MAELSISRRNFLKTAGITVAVGAAACAGVGIASTDPQIETINYQYGQENTMNKRILVTYATRTGSTMEIADKIGQLLAKRGCAVDVKAAKENPSVEGYDVVVAGSAIRMGSWLPEAVDFLKNHRSELAASPVYYFTVHTSNLADDDTSRAARLAYLNPVRELITAKEEAYFAGVINPAKMSLLARLMTSAMKAPTGDFRDWNKIESWANSIAI